MKYKFAFICHPLKNDSEKSFGENIEEVKNICRDIYEKHKGTIPIAPHLYFPQFMDDNNKKERADGLEFDYALIKSLKCDIWVYGHKISENMLKEIKLGVELSLPIECKEKSLERILEKVLSEF